jgi:CBS domain-containing protein
VVIIGADETVQTAAELMRRFHVGDVVVVEDSDNARVPVGILTDRDLVIEVMATGLSTDELAVKDVITEPLLTARDSDDLLETLGRMRTRGVRRIPVVREGDALVGILSVDDVIGLLADLIDDMAVLVGREREREATLRP